MNIDDDIYFGNEGRGGMAQGEPRKKSECLMY